MKSGKLTIKQENFCNFYVETGNASEAYRRAYQCARMKAETVNRKAKELIDNGKVAARVAELRDELKAKSDIAKEEIVRLLTDVVRGKEIMDVSEEKDGRRTTRTIPKAWAIEKLCKMLGFDSPDKKDITGNLSFASFLVESGMLDEA